MMIRKKYSKEFKLDAVSLVTEQGYNTRIEAARNLGVNANLAEALVKRTPSRMMDRRFAEKEILKN